MPARPPRSSGSVCGEGRPPTPHGRAWERRPWTGRNGRGSPEEGPAHADPRARSFLWGLRAIRPVCRSVLLTAGGDTDRTQLLVPFGRAHPRRLGLRPISTTPPECNANPGPPGRSPKPEGGSYACSGRAREHRAWSCRRVPGTARSQRGAPGEVDPWGCRRILVALPGRRTRVLNGAVRERTDRPSGCREPSQPPPARFRYLRQGRSVRSRRAHLTDHSLPAQEKNEARGRCGRSRPGLGPDRGRLSRRRQASGLSSVPWRMWSSAPPVRPPGHDRARWWGEARRAPHGSQHCPTTSAYRSPRSWPITSATTRGARPRSAGRVAQLRRRPRSQGWGSPWRSPNRAHAFDRLA
jgi:hypothetical protein